VASIAAAGEGGIFLVTGSEEDAGRDGGLDALAPGLERGGQGGKLEHGRARLADWSLREGLV
jgi:hypothetical protein